MNTFPHDIRWQQRFANYQKALAQLRRFLEHGNLNELEQQGLIQAFEYTYELAWQVMKDFLEHEGNLNISGSRSAMREAFKVGLIAGEAAWQAMITHRNLTVHTYNEDLANEIATAITHTYFALFVAFAEKMHAQLLLDTQK